MMYKTVVLFSSLFFSINSFAYNTSSVFDLMNQRMGLMTDVAANKYLDHQPIEVIEQEQKVLEKTLNIAYAEGLNPESVKPFIIAQMNVAKAIQYRDIADWLSQPDVQLHPKTLSDVRDRISSLTIQMIKDIANSLKKNADHTFEEKYFMQQVQCKHLTLSDQQYLLSNLQKIELRK